MSKPTLSVIVPVYNASDSIQHCTDSVFSSEIFMRGEAELILVNDGSTDNSGEVCAQITRRPSVKFLQTKNGGVSAARNHGLSIASREFIAFLDADDHVSPTYHQQMTDSLKDEDYSLAIAGITTVWESSNLVTTASQEDLDAGSTPTALVDVMKSGVFNSVCNKVYRASAVKNNRIQFEIGRKSAEDLFFNLDYLRAVKSGIRFVDNNGLFYVREKSSSTHVLENRYTELHELETSIAYRSTLTQTLCDIGVPQSHVEQYFRDKDNSWFRIMVRNIINPGTPYSPEEQLAQIRKIMSFAPARENIMSNRSRGRLAVLNRILYRSKSPRIVRMIMKRT